MVRFSPKCDWMHRYFNRSFYLPSDHNLGIASQPCQDVVFKIRVFYEEKASSNREKKKENIN